MTLYEDRMNLMIKNANATKVVIASPEIAYLPKEFDPAGIIKTGDGGGLAVIIAAEVEEAYKQGIDVHVIIPEYYDLYKKQTKLSDHEFEEALTLVATHPNVHLVDDGIFLHADKVYDDNSYALARIDTRRALQLTKGVVRAGKELNRTFPDSEKIIQLNDWGTALADAGLKEYDYFKKIKTEMKWHNTFSQVRPLIKLNEHGFNTQRYHKKLFYTNDFPSDDHGKDMYRLWVDFLTTGFLSADHVTAVGENIQAEALNGRLEKIDVMPKYMADMLRHRTYNREAGVVANEPSTHSNPQINPLLQNRYGTKDIIRGKSINKSLFQKSIGLDADKDAPIIYWPHRISEHKQKGAKLFIETIEDLMHDYADQRLQIAFVASGEASLVGWIKILQEKYQGRIAIKGFDRELSELGKAGSDFIMMPSLYEPRGFPQLEGPNYGTWTIAYKSVDGIHSFDTDPTTGNGWVFNDYNHDGLKYGVGQAMEFYKMPLDFKEKNLQRAREANLKEHNVQDMIKKSIATWEYMLGKNDPKRLILRNV